jgi:hypothetical protein
MMNTMRQQKGIFSQGHRDTVIYKINIFSVPLWLRENMAFVFLILRSSLSFPRKRESIIKEEQWKAFLLWMPRSWPGHDKKGGYPG